ncbi:D-alanyl-D-alanine carboxypeptidase [Variovorax boronicumulans]|uniref:D-alanyl-D-alanine carboxypeptidase family protein n=1 Tax=Variovorax boronicumulans TaxID=436515 RepID=UPI0027874459|nr:hypothetical protein [Variovorax boronicumulans]MDP9991955.1 D-alanyl-D-alanine carboxypeptidase [Variovorax boronicumulans]MDQ0001850.1 D-alanyl-D-alanine carboxypeptidase [Variovorax boronicumulans]
MTLNIKFQKDINTAQQPASLTKLLTSIVMRQWVNDAHLDDTVTVTSADLIIGSSASLTNGDVTTYRHLAYGMLLPSGNDAAHCVARNVGALIIAGGGGGSDPYARFVAEMNTQAAALGLATALFYDAYGLDSAQRMSPSDVSTLMLAFITDSFLLTVAGTYTHTMVITGANARSYSVTNTIDPAGAVPFPEYIAGKTGTTVDAGPCVVMLWELSSGGPRRISVVMNGASDLDRYLDLRKLINYERARSA